MSKYESHSTLLSSGDITLTAPYAIPSSNNSKLLSLLSKNSNSVDQKSKNDNTAKDIDERKSNDENHQYQLNLQLPTPKQFDASDIIEINNTKILTQQSNQKSITSNNDNNKVSKELVTEVINENDDPKYLIDIDSINPTNLKDQISTIIINNFPNLKNNVIENILLKLLNPSNDESKKFEWSTINGSEYIDQKVVFLRFSKLENLKWFIENYENDLNEIIPKIELIYNPKIKDTLSTIKVEDLNSQSIKEKLKNQIKLICFSSKNFETNSKTKGVEDLDHIMKSYSSYTVDNNDLIDVPKEMKDKIVKDIKIFRSKMLNIEKLNRQKQNEKERFKIKQKLNELYQNLKEVNDKNKENKDITGEVDDEYKDVIIPENQFENLNDKECEEMLKKIEVKEIETKYNTELLNFKSKEEEQKEILISKLQNLKNYETSIIDSKLESIEKLKNIEKNDLYNRNYNEYLKQRQIKRLYELEKDEEDQKLEEEELKANDSKASNIEIDQIEEPQTKKSKSSTSKSKSTLIINNLSSGTQQKIHQKINELIEEYLGIQDDILFKVINEHIKTYNLNNSDELIEELIEILDDDSKVLVNQLFNYIESIAE
ncbi:SNU71 [Candida pseudojiufengensis]|uniref:SNU71 n=1 Tax=Candida pseudojiufengensis TaxID=497109 RepID=UPI002224B858|nr:SNU71 [Candida pseudojiufengensis]KAI5963315.1 SNU71 [Candida pseudojiufengensis]